MRIRSFSVKSVVSLGARWLRDSSSSSAPSLMAILLGFAFLFNAHAQSNNGSDNPTGPAGMFNGNITTAGNYDPLTGNAMRSVTDLVVAGSVGDYPLAFTRTSNSRQVSSGYFLFGPAGAWTHNYAWSMGGTEESTSQYPGAYEIYFPDGRAEGFNSAGARTASGIREQVIPLNLSTMLCYLVLPDGGRVEFRATQYSRLDAETRVRYYWYSFVAQAIVDPHSLRTVLSYNANGSLSRITEPAGRWLQLSYTTTSWTNGSGQHDVVITQVSASDGRNVTYNYGAQAFYPGTYAYTYLGNVVYFGDSNVLAYYAYEAPNVVDANGHPLLHSAYDPMYAGPMKNMLYQYAGSNADLIAPAVGEIRAEHCAETSASVSSVNQNQVLWRTETRGDGANRTFYYNGPLLSQAEDFTNHAKQTFWYDTNGFISQIQDRLGNVTNFTNDPNTGNLTQITYPAINGVRATAASVFGSSTCPDPNNHDPHYLYSVTDENTHTTVYTRDANKRVAQVTYADSSL